MGATSARLFFMLALAIETLATSRLMAKEPPLTLPELLDMDVSGVKAHWSPTAAVRGLTAPHEHPDFADGPFLSKSANNLFAPMRQRMLVMTWFRNGGHTGLRYTVTESGFCHTVRIAWNWAEQANSLRIFMNGERAAIKDLLPTLPESDANPPIDRTVYITFRDGEGWRTETYDSDALPDEVERLMVLMGERFETRGRLKPPDTVSR